MINLNVQKPEGRVDCESLDVVDIWPTIQGEGPFAGDAAVFIRLAGCNLQCPQCDTDYTTGRTTQIVEEIIKKVDQAASSKLDKNTAMQKKINLVVITGGEPFRQNITPLVHTLIGDDYKVQIETNGIIMPAPGNGMPFPTLSHYVYVICSPKTPNVSKYLTPYIYAWKYVIDARNVDPRDGLPTHTLGNSCGVARPWDMGTNYNERIYVQPAEPFQLSSAPSIEEWSQYNEEYEQNKRACIESCMKFGYRMGIQLHKVIKVK